MSALEAFFCAFTQPICHPAQVLAIGALALLMSLWERDRIDQGLLWVGAGTATGIAASMFGTTVPTEFPLLICAVLAAAGVADRSHMPRLMRICLAAFTGLGIGLGSPLAAADLASWTAACVGLSLGVCTWVFHGAALVQHVRRLWGEVPARLLGSWAIAGAFVVFFGALGDPAFSGWTGGAVLR
jgi:hypothetical protein